MTEKLESGTPESATPEFDYIIVGSGAGGGPLAARLAEAGKCVLVLEAGSDHRNATGGSRAPATEVSLAPLLHGVSTEHDDLSWRFFVKHYEDPDKNPVKRDPKWHEGSRPDGQDTGIFYPRAAAIGGCTVHNAMITIAGPDADWDALADFLHDDSWNGRRMRYYFQKMERCEYLPESYPVPKSVAARAWDSIRWLFGFDPDYSRGRHGFDGWLHTSRVDVSLAFKDVQLFKMLKAALVAAQRTGIESGLALLRSLKKNEINTHLDPNHAKTQAESPEGLVLIPLAVCGERTTAHEDASMPNVQRGRRSSPREFLLATQRQHPDKLMIWTDCLVTRVLFDEGDKPRAVGVEFLRGKNLYHAHVTPSAEPGDCDQVFVKEGGEVILCGGSFNTPQLLMLSGIGDEAHLAEISERESDKTVCLLHGRDGKPLPEKTDTPRRIHLPGVGKNLQDRYEVTLISEMKADFTLLDGATIQLPSDSGPDRHLHEWRESGTGLYASNGAVAGIFKRSKPELAQPDLFIFGIPAPFKGYAVGYSNVGHIHNNFTWTILKSHTSNREGEVRLRDADPRRTPAINFHYFNELARKRANENNLKMAEDDDLLALVEGVKFVRQIFDNARPVAPKGIHPSLSDVPIDDDEALKKWIQQVAWGHHACGTCRMGPDGDPNAVLDSRFRVRQVNGLRVVDASIFSTIPGYFIVANIYMASEKAADVILEDHPANVAEISKLPAVSATYPRELAAFETDAIATRRKKIGGAATDVAERGEWASDVVGLGLSGGGIRSAAFNLGVIQALARHRWLRRIDFLSTVSGGGYIGSFLGRIFDRKRNASLVGNEHSCHPEEIEAELANPKSREATWLRKHGNYLAPGGMSDGQLNTATFVRGFLSVHFVVGIVLFAWFCLANLLRYGIFDKAFAAFGFLTVGMGDMPIGHLIQSVFGPFFSPWFICCELILLFLVLPRLLGYWAASQDTHERFQGPTLALLFLMAGVLLYLSVANGLSWESFLLALAVMSTFVHVELAWRRGRIRERAVGSGGTATQPMRTRNILTYDLGLSLALASLLFAFAVVDTLGHGLQQLVEDNYTYATAFASLGGVLLALMPIARFVANRVAQAEGGRGAGARLLRMMAKRAIGLGMMLLLLLTPLVFVSFAAHAAFAGGGKLWAGLAVTILAWVISVILRHPRALAFVNRSSLAQTYGARLSRAFLGASNPVRHTPRGANITEVVPGDDVSTVRDYKPHEAGGPLHLINVTVNQTVDFTSQRGNRDRQGDNVAVSSIGMSVGDRFHSTWIDGPENRRTVSTQPSSISLKPIGHPPGTEHPLLDVRGRCSDGVETLSLREWMGISGAAIAPGRGQGTSLGTSLLFGLANLRTGHWWDSGISEFDRDGFPKLSFLRRLLYLIPGFFLVQSLLLREWIARFSGPWSQYWYLSDGGFFENLGGYELIRRRVPRIILCDAGADPDYEFEDFANFVRKVRIDFEADIVPFSSAELAEHAGNLANVIGTMNQLKPKFDATGKLTEAAERHAALFWVHYRTPSRGGLTDPRRSVLLYVKATLPETQTADVLHYQAAHPEFPHESTTDQFFDEAQWESYRQLGELLATPLVQPERGQTSNPWFWRISLAQRPETTGESLAISGPAGISQPN